MSKPKPIDTLEKQLKYSFKDKDLLKRALTHRSYLNELKYKDAKHNERLEFLGDAVLELLITKYLFENYPERPEGELTSFRAAVVRTESLAETAGELNIGEYLYMSKGEESTGGRERPYILANTIEALLGAFYVDGGITPCKQFVDTYMVPKLPKIIEDRLDIDPKSKLQEIAQELYKYTPTYELVEETGPDHDRTFIMKVIVNNEEFGQGEGKNKQEAEQNAAEAALNKLKEEKPTKKH